VEFVREIFPVSFGYMASLGTGPSRCGSGCGLTGLLQCLVQGTCRAAFAGKIQPAIRSGTVHGILEMLILSSSGFSQISLSFSTHHPSVQRALRLFPRAIILPY